MNRKYPHFAIPEIYGDSLSYYELLRKLVEAMNAVIENYDTIPDQIAEAVANLDASQLFSEVLKQLIESIATDNTKSANAVKVYKKHDLLYATFNDNVNLYESLIDFSTGTGTELIPGTNIREVNISELFIELRKLIDINKNNIDTVTAVANDNSAEISTLRTMISSPYNFKGDVANISALPASGEVNDTYYVQDVKYKVTWTGSAWVQSSLSETDYEKELSELKSDLTDETNRAKNRENEIEELFTMPTQEAVNTWLGEHPEATTTVQDGSILEEKLNNNMSYYRKANFYDCVADMTSDENLKVGRIAVTFGYYVKGDGGGATYSIISETKDTYDYIPCVNGVAELQIIDNTLNFLQLGAKNDNSEDCSNIMNYAQSSNRWFNIYIPSGTYKFTRPIYLYTDKNGTGLPNHNLYGDRHASTWDNYKKVTVLNYYPSEENTCFLNIGGYGLYVHDLKICNKVFGLYASGIDFHVTRGHMEKITIEDFDYDSLKLDSPYSIISDVTCCQSNDFISYVKEDITNRRAHALCAMSNTTTNCGNVVTNLTLGSPQYNIHEYGLIVGGLNNKFIAPFIPSPALYPIYFQSVCNACTIENMYSEAGTSEGEVFITFAEGSRNNRVINAYMSGSVNKIVDNGYMNVVDNIFTNLVEIGPTLHFTNMSKNLFEGEFQVVDGAVRIVNSTTENMYELSMTGGCATDIDESGFIVCNNAISKFEISGRISANSKLIKEIIKMRKCCNNLYLVSGCYISNDSDFNLMQIPSIAFLYGVSAASAKAYALQHSNINNKLGSVYSVAKIPEDLTNNMWASFSNIRFYLTEGHIAKIKPFLFLVNNSNVPIDFNF